MYFKEVKELFDLDIYNRNKNSFVSWFEEQMGGLVNKIDKDKGVVYYDKPFHDELKDDCYWAQTSSSYYRDEFISKVDDVIAKLLLEIKTTHLEILSKGFSTSRYISEMYKTLEYYTKLNYVEEYFIGYPIVKIKEVLQILKEDYNYKKIILSDNLTNISYGLSFSMDPAFSSNAEDILRGLYNTLITEQIIIGEENDFVKAFMNEPLEDNSHIKWMLKRGIHLKKSSLFVFVAYMCELFLIDELDSDLNKKIHNVFRDFKGSKITHLDQDKNSFKNKMIEYEDSIKEYVEKSKDQDLKKIVYLLDSAIS